LRSIGLIDGREIGVFKLLACVDLIPLHNTIGKLLGRLNLRLLKFPSYLDRVNRRRIVDEVVVLFPPAAFDKFEGHFFGQTVPVINVGACVDSSDCQI